MAPTLTTDSHGRTLIRDWCCTAAAAANYLIDKSDLIDRVETQGTHLQGTWTIGLHWMSCNQAVLENGHHIRIGELHTLNLLFDASGHCWFSNESLKGPYISLSVKSDAQPNDDAVGKGTWKGDKRTIKFTPKGFHFNVMARVQLVNWRL